MSGEDPGARRPTPEPVLDLVKPVGWKPTDGQLASLMRFLLTLARRRRAARRPPES